MRRALMLAGSAMVLGAFLGVTNLAAQSEFPHEKHSLFFSDCTACHADVASGNWMDVYPDVSTCAACHDGTTAPRVGWTPAEGPRTSNLAFKHEPHGFGCAMCHLPGGEEDIASLRIPSPRTCLGCHAPDASGHMGAVDQCLTCHVPAQEAGLPMNAISGFPRPESHRFGGFIEGHRSAAATSPEYCAVCHTESSCTSCHEGQGAPGFHPLNFMASHGPEAFGRSSDCSSCHSAEAFCRACHTGVGLNSPAGFGGAYHDSESFWIQSHAQAARQDLESCVSCHQQTDCQACHSARSGLGVNPHGPDFNGSSINEQNKAMCTLCHISGG
jgi:hypothetical protein